ncbi:MAG: ATP-binding cassette domain-containing protein [Oscillospiraceae bacterium]
MSKPTRARKMDARFASREFRGDEVLQLKGVSKSFGDRTLFSDVYLRVEGGERIASRRKRHRQNHLLNMIAGAEPDDGRIRQVPPSARRICPRSSTSTTRSWFPFGRRCGHEKRNITPQTARNRLAAYQFQGEDVFKSVSVLSGGELSRLRLCMLMDEEINFLILDEPTNHLDIASREWIEEAVEALDGTLLFVSHDRYFINRFATRVWEPGRRGYHQRLSQRAARFFRCSRHGRRRKKPRPRPGPEEKQDTPGPSGPDGKAAARRQLTISRNRHLQAGGALPPAGRRNGTERLRRGKAPGTVSGEAGSGRGPTGAGTWPAGRSCPPNWRNNQEDNIA